MLFIFPWHDIRICISTNQDFPEGDGLIHFQGQNSHGRNQYSSILCEVLIPRLIQKVEVLEKMELTRFRGRASLCITICSHDIGSHGFDGGVSAGNIPQRGWTIKNCPKWLTSLHFLLSPKPPLSPHFSVSTLLCISLKNKNNPKKNLICSLSKSNTSFLCLNLQWPWLICSPSFYLEPVPLFHR